MKKSKKVILTLLSTITLGSCSTEQKHTPNPYDDYSWAGTSRDSGMMYTHYDHGILRYYLFSRMFDGFGYNRFMPYSYYRRRNDREGGGYYGGGHGFSSYSNYGQSLSSAHGSIGRGGFGGNGFSHGGGARG